VSTWTQRLTDGLSKSRDLLAGQLNTIVGRGIEFDDAFWDDMEDALLVSDLGLDAATAIVARMKREIPARAHETLAEVKAHLVETIADEFADGVDPFEQPRAAILMVGVNGTGKTTSAGKLAKQAVDVGKTVVLGSADTFRAAATEQLETWAQRADVPLVKRGQGADAASVAYETIEQAHSAGVNLAIIDTAGRLHTSPDLMRELEKIQRVARERGESSVADAAEMPVFTVLVLDATTGQNGLIQAREFHKTLGLDALIVTKLDGTAKGGIALAISKELNLPIVRLGVGETIDDLRAFDAREFAEALVG